MYQVGELIIYGKTGVCEVTEITLDAAGSAAGYVLNPLYRNSSISIPADNPKVFTRPVISRDEAMALIHALPALEAEPYVCRNLNQLRTYYMERLNCRSCLELARLAKSLYLKQKQAEAQKKKFGSVDERFLREAENLLFGEMAVALGIERDEVQKFIANCLDQA